MSRECSKCGFYLYSRKCWNRNCEAFSIEPRTLAQHLRVGRCTAKISVHDLAYKANVSYVTIKNYESGRSAPDIMRFIELCNIVAIDPAEVIAEVAS